MSTTKVSTPNSNDKMVSTFKKTVSLDDWWLITSEKDFNGRKLAVAGIKSENGYMATRIFSSAPIVKAYGMFNVITADGIPVFLNDYINKTRTCENGFSTEVCNCFAVGFPTYWEDFSYNCGEGFTPRTTSRHSKKRTNTKDADPEQHSSKDQLVDSSEKPHSEWSVKSCKTSEKTDKSNEKLKYLSNRLTALCGSGGKTFARTPDKTLVTLANSGEKSRDTMVVVSEDFDHDIIKRSTRLDEEKQWKRKIDDEIVLAEKPTRVLRSRSRLQC